MNFNIEILNVTVVTKPTAKGSYEMAEVAFKRLDTGKVEGKKIMSFTFKEVFNTLKSASPGTQLTVTTEKNEKTTYWDWTGIAPLGAASTPPAATGSPAKAAGFSSPKSNYETSEERAARQVLIVRQSSLSAAVAVLKNDKKPAEVNDVLELADVFSRWVFQKDVKLEQPTDVSFEEMENDIPY